MNFLGGVAWALFRCLYKYSTAPLTGLSLDNMEEADYADGANKIKVSSATHGPPGVLEESKTWTAFLTVSC